jgi:hypothetical protein
LPRLNGRRRRDSGDLRGDGQFDTIVLGSTGYVIHIRSR